MMRWFCLPALVAGLLSGPTIPAQTPASCPPGFAAAAVLAERSQPSQVRGFAADPARGAFYLGIGRTVFHRPDPWTWLSVHQCNAPEDLGIVLRPAGRTDIWFTALHGGTVFVLDPATQSVTSFAGVANIFDLAVAATGEVLVTANPAWPAPGSSTGVWHIGPQSTPREVLRLQGPSGPLLFDQAGNLVVADLGGLWPIPPGGVRLLRFPTARWHSAVHNHGTLTIGDADLIAPGWDGAYDLASDDQQRIYVTDPGHGIVHRTMPGSLQRDPTAACTASGSSLQLQWSPGGVAPFLPFQPGDHASSLLISHSDFASEYAVRQLQPERPTLALWPGATFGAGTGRAIVSGPSNGLALLAITTGASRAETIAATIDGAPLWLGFDPTASLASVLFGLDAQGSGNLALRHPGGFALSLHLQVAVLAPGGVGHGTSATVALQLLP